MLEAIQWGLPGGLDLDSRGSESRRCCTRQGEHHSARTQSFVWRRLHDRCRDARIRSLTLHIGPQRAQRGSALREPVENLGVWPTPAGELRANPVWAKALHSNRIWPSRRPFSVLPSPGRSGSLSLTRFRPAGNLHSVYCFASPTCAANAGTLCSTAVGSTASISRVAAVVGYEQKPPARLALAELEPESTSRLTAMIHTIGWR